MLRVHPIKQLASTEGREAGDLLRVLVVLGLREAFQDTEHLEKRLKYSGFVSRMLRPLRAHASNVLLICGYLKGLPRSLTFTRVRPRQTGAKRSENSSRLELKLTAKPSCHFARRSKHHPQKRSQGAVNRILTKQQIASKSHGCRNPRNQNPDRIQELRRWQVFEVVLKIVHVRNLIQDLRVHDKLQQSKDILDELPCLPKSLIPRCLPEFN
jgi:hypothetical protein